METTMSKLRDRGWSRREFLGTAALAGTGAFLGVRPDAVGADAPPEITKISLVRSPGIICIAPLYVAEEFLRGEGFSEVQYITKKGRIDANKAVASGEAQITITFNGLLSIQVDEGDPIVTLAGLRAGSYPL